MGMNSGYSLVLTNKFSSSPHVKQYTVGKKCKWPCVPEEVKDIDWSSQRSVYKHLYFLDNVRLRKKGGKTEHQHERDNQLIVEQAIHGFLCPVGWLHSLAVVHIRLESGMEYARIDGTGKNSQRRFY